MTGAQSAILVSQRNTAVQCDPVLPRVRGAPRLGL